MGLSAPGKSYHIVTAFGQDTDTTAVNSLVSDHPWGMTKWSFTGGCHLWERSTK